MELHEVEKDQIVEFQHVTLGYIVGRILQIPAWQDGMVSIIHNYNEEYATEVFAYVKDISIHDPEEELKRKIQVAKVEHKDICRMLTDLYALKARTRETVVNAQLKLKKFKRDAKIEQKNNRARESKG